MTASGFHYSSLQPDKWRPSSWVMPILFSLECIADLEMHLKWPSPDVSISTMSRISKHKRSLFCTQDEFRVFLLDGKQKLMRVVCRTTGGKAGHHPHQRATVTSLLLNTPVALSGLHSRHPFLWQHLLPLPIRTPPGAQHSV